MVGTNAPYGGAFNNTGISDARGAAGSGMVGSSPPTADLSSVSDTSC